MFGSSEGLQAAYDAANDRRVLEIELEEPTAPFGLKGAPVPALMAMAQMLAELAATCR